MNSLIMRRTRGVAGPLFQRWAPGWLIHGVGNFISATGAAWSPARLFASGERGAWYDPSDRSTLFQDSAGTTPVTADGQPVGKILDKSGRNNHATQATAAKRPLYKTNGILHWLQFDGVDDALTIAMIDFTATDKITLFAGIQKLVSAAGVICELSSNSNENAGSFYFVAGLNICEGYTSSSRGTVLPSSIAKYCPVVGVDTAVVSSTHDISNSLSNIRRNGVNGSASIADKGLGNFGNYPLFIGARNKDSLYLNGSLYSIIVLGRLATTQEITDTETWVNGKTGAY